MKQSIFIGYDPREDDAYQACLNSIFRFRREERGELPHIHPLNLGDLRRAGLYRRPTIEQGHGRGSKRWDVISGAPMSTEFAISRFLTPLLARVLYDSEWAIFVDCDVIFRADPAELFALADKRYAVQVVKHGHQATQATKMDDQPQLAYDRKNWSSVILWNCRHGDNVAGLQDQQINSAAGIFLHRFLWLPDALIGELPREWNHLVGVDSPDPAAKLAHFTLGVPSMAGYENCEFADEWRAMCGPA